jgi:hypothetical protein
MKKVLLLLFLTLASITYAQDLTQFNQDRIDLTKSGMLVLGSWAILNMASSPILANQSDGSRKYFHQMNGYWNVINFGLAGIGYFNLTKQDPATFTLSQTLAEQASIEKILLLNTGLDIAYVLGGLYMVELSNRKTKNKDLLKGFGQSIMLQGAFLFTFDLVFYFFQQKHGSELLNIVEQLTIAPQGFSFQYSF